MGGTVSDNSFNIGSWFNLGINRHEMLKKIGMPDKVFENVEYYQQKLSFSVHYNPEGKVEYIEISKPEPEVTIALAEINVFKTPASELIRLVESKTQKQFDRIASDIPYSYIFPGLELSFWRPVIPENEQDEDGKFFETIGVGVKGYYSS